AAAEWPDPHGFLLAVRAPGLVGRVAMLAQEQVARFLRDDGESVWTASSLSSAGPGRRFLRGAGAAECGARPRRARGHARAAPPSESTRTALNASMRPASADASGDPEPARAA